MNDTTKITTLRDALKLYATPDPDGGNEHLAAAAALAATEGMEADPVTAGEREKWLSWYSGKYTSYIPTDASGEPINFDTMLSWKTWQAALAERGTVGEPVGYFTEVMHSDFSVSTVQTRQDDPDAFPLYRHPAPVGDVGLPVQASIVDDPKFEELLCDAVVEYADIPQFGSDPCVTYRAARRALIAYIDAQRAPQVAQVVAGGLSDAARLDFIERNSACKHNSAGVNWQLGQYDLVGRYLTLREAIDAAMKGGAA